MWHARHACVACTPTNAKPVVAWSNDPVVQLRAEAPWQGTQSCGKAPDLCGGLVVLFVVVLGKSKRRELVDVATNYWHFLGVLWIALYWVLITA